MSAVSWIRAFAAIGVAALFASTGVAQDASENRRDPTARPPVTLEVGADARATDSEVLITPAAGGGLRLDRGSRMRRVPAESGQEAYQLLSGSVTCDLRDGVTVDGGDVVGRIASAPGTRTRVRLQVDKGTSRTVGRIRCDEGEARARTRGWVIQVPVRGSLNLWKDFQDPGFHYFRIAAASATVELRRQVEKGWISGLLPKGAIGYFEAQGGFTRIAIEYVPESSARVVVSSEYGLRQTGVVPSEYVATVVDATGRVDVARDPSVVTQVTDEVEEDASEDPSFVAIDGATDASLSRRKRR